ncbi:MAG: large conductance mechanosensitive channel protein MscL [Acholeplasmataceae bacterium]|nr:large conductance mechanosensitive channel protein MscL [Acholeplasmataceae bacterium]
MKRGNVLDLAVAVIIGGAFGKIIASLVKDILMPVISLLVGPEGFDNYKYVIQEADPITGAAENAIYFGLFIQNIIDFIIIAFVVFIIVRLFSKATSIAQAKKIEEERTVKALAEVEKKRADDAFALKPKTEDLLVDIKKLLEKKFRE